MIYTVTFNPSIDRFFESISSDVPYRTTFGGKGINVSVCLKNLGVDSVALGFCAGNNGKLLKSLLAKENIKFDFVELACGETRINNKYPHKEFNGIGPLVLQADFQKLLNKIDPKPNDILVVSGSQPNGIDNAYIQIAKKFKTCKIVFDTNGKTLKDLIKYSPYLIKPNADEFFDLTGSNEVTASATKLLHEGVQNILLTLGENGSVLFNQNFTYRLAALNGKVISTVACGDCSLAGFLYGSKNSLDIKEAFYLSAACGNACAFAGKIPTRKQVLSALEKIKNQ